MMIFRIIGKRYSQFLVTYPSVVMLLVLLVVIISAGLGVLLNELSSFDNPTKGFEARGTVISGRLKALRRMEYGADGVYPCPSSSNKSDGDMCSHRVTRDIQNQTLDDDVLGSCTLDCKNKIFAI
ncbi:uncharacterized protein LOC115924432 [Strongylocentrotus purpuratus]|uniref:Uncharacterized protein n=1 Tax=Strongylocentrotus purpuratus TaxID=7668 RepID=A0A7M7NVL0_STRPU|nr:uncharacterized protein LOC115924432 [Strongylocentrotus purpuratus]|eukprot:XP_011678835.1 PREDICTED: uncharacterized protein LOC582965 [Strongylocentrotus purpuratus]